MSYCEYVSFPLISWVRCATWLYRFLIFTHWLCFNNDSCWIIIEQKKKICLNNWWYLNDYICIALRINYISSIIGNQWLVCTLTCIYDILKPLTNNKSRFHCVGMELLNFSEAHEIARKHWYFRVKGLSWRLYIVLTATMVLLQSSHDFLLRSTEFLLAILCALTTLSRHSQCVNCTFTVFALRWWHVEDTVASQRTPYKCL